MLSFCREEAEKFSQKQLEVLNNEIKINGSYEEWHEALSDFRSYLSSKFIKFKIGQKYRHKYLVIKSGDIIDHHIISYFAPLSFKRTGWNHEKVNPVEQVKKISKYFRQKNKRFIYIAIPNKCNIYPEIICEDLSLLNGKTIYVPQWRKYIRELILAGVEVIDMLPVFMRHKDDFALFSKDHYVSSLGAKLVADTAAEYLYLTVLSFPNKINLEHEYQYIFSTNPHKYEELVRVCFIMKDGKRIPFWNQNAASSKIAIFGDCNLQSRTSIGGGISANLACNLNHPVYNAGRKLIFQVGNV